MPPRKNKRYAPLQEIFGASEAADCIGVKIQNLSSIRDLPEPDVEIKAGRIWRAAVIRDFAKDYKARQRARRRKRDQDPDLVAA